MVTVPSPDREACIAAILALGECLRTFGDASLGIDPGLIPLPPLAPYLRITRRGNVVLQDGCRATSVFATWGMGNKKARVAAAEKYIAEHAAADCLAK